MASSTRSTRSRAATAAAATSSSSQPSTSAAAASHITGTNVYPQGCKEVHEEMHVDELIRRLKTLASTFQSMGQEENAYDEYVPLCLHLAEEGFLNHPSRDVRLLIACCIADILRIYAPEAPYKDPDQVKTIFKFLISQLEGLKDPKDAAFKRYFYLLENLAYVKSFNMCFELDDAQDIFCSLFDLIFSIVNDEHSGKVKSFMLDVLCPLVSECDTVSNELLNIILMNIVEPIKSSKKNAYNLAKELIIKCSETLESYIQNFFNQVLICGGKEDQNLLISHKVYDLIYELNHICPSVLLSVIPQLEYKLKSPDEAERLGSVSLLARMFSEKESNLATHHVPLWQAFLSRFNDVSVAIRTKCVQYSMHFLLNHAELRSDIVETLRLRQHDAEENVRFEVVKAIVATAKLDFNIVSDSEDLLNYVKERTLDKKFKIRREALQGLALIYKKHLGMENVPEPTERAAAWMKDKILHGYYMVLLDDRILVERLLNTCLVPYQLEPKDRMSKLLYLYSTIDNNATKAFIEIQKNLVLVRRHVAELLSVIRNHETKMDYAKQLNFRISSLTKFLPDPVKASEFICKFSNDLKEDKSLMRTMEIIVSPTTDCKTCAESVNMVLKKLGAPVMTNLYYNTIKILLERTSSVLIDRDAITKLVTIMKEIVEGNSNFFTSFNVPTDVVIEKGFNLISVLAFVFANHFDDEKVLETLIKLLSNEHLVSERVSSILSALMYIGKVRPIGQYHPNLMGVLVPQCQNMLVTGTPRQGKMAVRCLHVNMKESARNHTFAQVVEALRANLDPSNASYCTSIVALGHIALLMPEEFKYDMKAIVSQKIVKELLVNPRRTYDDHLKNSDSWCDEEDLPEITRCMVHGMKATVRWLMGLKTDFKSAAKTFKMLTAFVETGGTFINAEVPFSDSEKAWLRLAAGSCMLKICEQKGVGDQFTAVQFCSLAKLMNDEVEQVRSRFATKLHKGLSRGIPHKCLPLDFMGFYALVGYETDKQLRATARNYMVQDVNRRREYIKSLLMNASDKAADQLPHIMPDYMLVFAVPVLTHNPKFSSHIDTDQLTAIRECLWFILEPLIVKNDSYSFGFYKTLIERMKNHKNALEPEDEEANSRMYSICDIALGLILQRSSSFEMKDHPSEPRIPPMYFKRHEDPYWVNQRVYLPAEMQYSAPKKAGVTVNVESTAGSTSTGTSGAAASSSAAVPNKKNNRKGKRDSTQVVDEHGNVSIDAQPTDAKLTRLEIPGIHKNSESGDEGEANNDNENNQGNPTSTAASTTTTASASQASNLISAPVSSSSLNNNNNSPNPQQSKVPTNTNSNNNVISNSNSIIGSSAKNSNSSPTLVLTSVIGSPTQQLILIDSASSVDPSNTSPSPSQDTYDSKRIHSQNENNGDEEDEENEDEDETIEAIQEEVSKVIQTKTTKAENGVSEHQQQNKSNRQGNAVNKADAPTSRPVTRVSRKRTAKDSEDESSDSSTQVDKNSSSSKDSDGISTRKSASGCSCPLHNDTQEQTICSLARPSKITSASLDQSSCNSGFLKPFSLLSRLSEIEVNVGKKKAINTIIATKAGSPKLLPSTQGLENQTSNVKIATAKKDVLVKLHGIFKTKVADAIGNDLSTRYSNSEEWQVPELYGYDDQVKNKEKKEIMKKIVVADVENPMLTLNPPSSKRDCEVGNLKGENNVASLEKIDFTNNESIQTVDDGNSVMVMIPKSITNKIGQSGLPLVRDEVMAIVKLREQEQNILAHRKDTDKSCYIPMNKRKLDLTAVIKSGGMNDLKNKFENDTSYDQVKSVWSSRRKKKQISTLDSIVVQQGVKTTDQTEHAPNFDLSAVVEKDVIAMPIKQLETVPKVDSFVAIKQDVMRTQQLEQVDIQNEVETSISNTKQKVAATVRFRNCLITKVGRLSVAEGNTEIPQHEDTDLTGEVEFVIEDSEPLSIWSARIKKKKI